MGVYISDLEIPPKGKGVVVILCSSRAVYSGGQKVGIAVPVHPHGRLIDADAFISFIRENWDSYDQWFAEMIEARPIIIPADPAEEGET